MDKHALVTGHKGIIGRAVLRAIVEKFDGATGVDKQDFDLEDGAQRNAAINYALSFSRNLLAVVMADRATPSAQLAFAVEAAEYMKRWRGGSIVFLSSIYGMVGADSRIYGDAQYRGEPMTCPPEYAAEKGAVIALTRHLACEWARFGIRVNCISPGGVESGQPADFVERYSARVPMGRMARAEEIADAVVFLASDASSYITGHNLVVDGGLTAW